MTNILRHFGQQCVNLSSQRAAAILPVSVSDRLCSRAAGGGLNLSASILTSLQRYIFLFCQLNGLHPRSTTLERSSSLSDTGARDLPPGRGRVGSPILTLCRNIGRSGSLLPMFLQHLVTEAFAGVNNVIVK